MIEHGPPPGEEPEWMREVEADFQRSRLHLPTRRLSWSQISTFKMCPACYEGSYILNLQQASRHPMGFVGAGVSKALQVARELNRKQSPLYRDTIIMAAREQFHNRAAGISDWGKEDEHIAPVEWGKLKDYDTTLNLMMRMADAAVQTFVTQEDPEMYLGVEVKLEYGDTFPFAFTGYCDALFKHPQAEDGVIIEDDKTVNDPGPRLFKQGDLMQLASYALPIKDSGRRWQVRVGQVSSRGYGLTKDEKTGWKELKAAAKKEKREFVPPAGTRDATAPTATLIPAPLTKVDLEWVRKEVIKTAFAISACYREGSFPVSDSNFHRYDHGAPKVIDVLGIKGMAANVDDEE